MAITVYTYNDKVLKNSATDKWLKKPDAPIIEEVTIGNQTWMAKNLAIDDGGAGISVINDVTANNVNFGTQYYYTWDAAVRVAASIQGWHLPSNSEFDTLASYIGSGAGTKLKSTSGWNNNNNGTDDYNFTGLPVGFAPIGQYSGQGDDLYMWTSTAYEDEYYYRELNLGTSLAYGTQLGNVLHSVRLIKDT
jgi:uncharacterized protein (TIGR02145 family)